MSNGNRTTVLRWNGNSWSALGNVGFSASQTSLHSIALESSGNPVIAYKEAANTYGMTVMRWDGTNWNSVGTPGFTSTITGPGTIPSFSSRYLALDNADNPVIAFTSGYLYAKRFVPGPTSLAEISSEFYLKSYPNPTSEFTTVQFNAKESTNYRLRLTDMLGRTALNFDGIAVNGQNEIQVPVNNLSKGIYLMEVEMNKKKQITKLVVQ